MSFFSNLDTAIQEQAAGRGREPVAVGAVGVCLEDSGQPVVLYKIDTIYGDGELELYRLDCEDVEGIEPRRVYQSEFWVLLPAL